MLAPVSNFGLHDRGKGVVTVNSSVGAWKKLERIRRNPQVALAFHSRAHATHDRPEYVLLQGRATLKPPVADYPATVLEHWERIEPWRDLGPLWKRWLRIYALRVEIEIAATRVIAWPDLSCRGQGQCYGAPPPGSPPSQKPPTKGTEPRVDPVTCARKAARLPHTLLGWVGGDGFPVIVPVSVMGADERGLLLEPAPDLVPPGGRRAGLTSHWYSRGVVGQRQRIHTGWMEAAPGQPLLYSPHTLAAYGMPNSRLVYRLAVGFYTRLRYRQASSHDAARFRSTRPATHT